jgi:hypothetical protein
VNYQNISFTLFIVFVLNGTFLAMETRSKEKQRNVSQQQALSNNVSRRKNNNNQQYDQQHVFKRDPQLGAAEKKQYTQKIDNNNKLEVAKKGGNKSFEGKKQRMQPEIREEIEFSCPISKKNKMSRIFFRDEEGELFYIPKDTKSSDNCCMELPRPVFNLKNSVKILNWKKYRRVIG